MSLRTDDVRSAVPMAAADDEHAVHASVPDVHVADAWTVRIRACAWAAVVTLGALQAWAGRLPVVEEGVSYLDIADAILRRDWRNAVNASSSPLYSWVLAIGLGLTRPSPFWESTVVHAVNFCVYIGSFLAFEFFLSQLMVLHRHREDDALRQWSYVLVPSNALLALAYGLFLWATTQWITVRLETPDMLLTIFVFAAAGLLVRMRNEAATGRTDALYGAVLALAYLAKSVMLPLFFVFAGLILLVVPNRAAALRGIGVASLCVVVVIALQVGAISWTKGSFTTGHMGKLAYVWHPAEATDRDDSWHAELSNDQRPLRPARGVSWSLETWRQVFVTDGYFVAIAAFTLFAVGFWGWRSLFHDLAGSGELLAPLLVALPLYTVVRLSPRDIAVFVVLFWIGLFAAVRLPLSALSRRLAWGAMLGVLLVIGFRLMPSTTEAVHAIARTASASCVEDAARPR